jgi:hydroxymethylpyrimidine/phosphomethylpyrimidine kinase
MPDLPPIVLVFAASDPSGGAGLQADIMTLSSMGCHPLSVVTAVTIQDTTGVDDVSPIDAEWVADQARCVLEDMASEEMVAALRELLVPQTTIITPNSLEARRLAIDDNNDDDDPDLAECAQRLIASGCEYVLVTGTHENTPQVVNTLYGQDGVLRSDSWQRLPGSYHGSGCTLASAIAATIANGLAIGDAVKDAQEYTWQTLKAAFRPGMGQHIPDRLFWAREDEPAEERGAHEE